MAKKKGQKADKIEQYKNQLKKILQKEFRALRFRAWLWLAIILAVGGGGFWFFRTQLRQPPMEWASELTFFTVFILVLFFILLAMVNGRQRRLNFLIADAAQEEYGYLRTGIKRAKALQELATTLRATLSVERVLDSALNVCTMGLQEMGIPEKHIVAGILLYEEGKLVIVAHRRLHHDLNSEITEEVGAIGDALTQAEPVITNEPDSDPSLSSLGGLRRCETVVCLPLRVGFNLFGVMLVGSEVKIQFSEEYMDLFQAVADQAVIALQNAQLYQNLEQEKQRLIEAESEARKELARDLHDGPTQSVSAIAMRINFVRSLLNVNAEQAMTELFQIEELANQTAKDIRGMLFTLRPLILETQGLGPAINTLMEQIEEDSNIQTRLFGSEVSDLLNPKAQGVLFYIIEEALNNARKYSQADSLEVRFWQEQDLFVARIQDDGAGFDVESVTGDYESRGSLGMINMKERAEMIDGSIRVDSQPGRGTAITVVVPLDKQGIRV